MASSEDSATHVVDWNEDVDSAPDSVDDFIRILEVKGPTDEVEVPTGTIPAAGGAALVHWWYYPDSYNEWIPDTEISAGDSPDLASLTAPTRDKWYVCCRFILDCEIFNEWGNPNDYENENNETLGAEEVALEQLSAAAGAQDMVVVGEESPRDRSSTKKSRNRKRFSQLAVSSYDKDRQLAKGAPILGALSGVEKLQPDAIPPSLKTEGGAHVLEMSSNPADSKIITTESTKAGDCEVGGKRTATDAQLDAAECILPAGAAEHSWFQQNTASTFEIDILGSTCTSDPVDYIKVRNGIIALCCQSPLQYITATECRRKLPGDVSKILQVHEFLNAFGLINSRARREARPDVPASLLLASGTVSQQERSSNGAEINQKWTAKEDQMLINAIGKSRGDGSSIDWKVVAESLHQNGEKEIFSPAECAARFVELQLPNSMPKTSDCLAGTENLAAQVRNLTKVRKRSNVCTSS